MKIITCLGGLLVLQIFLATGLFLVQSRSDASYTPSAFFELDVDSVDRISIEGPEMHAVLAKEDGQWHLPELQDLAADNTRIEGMLASIAALEADWPVATSASSQSRFEVAENKFQRHVSLYDGEQTVAEFYLGTSPGFRQTHARRSGEDNIFALGINTFDLPANNNDWLDKTLLQPGNFSRITGTDFELVKEDDDWQFNRAGQTQDELDTSKAENLTSALENLRIQEVADAPGEEATAEITVGNDTDEWRYQFTKEGEQYYVKRSDMDTVFTISSITFQNIAAADRSSLLKNSAAAEEKQGTTGNSSGDSE